MVPKTPTENIGLGVRATVTSMQSSSSTTTTRPQSEEDGEAEDETQTPAPLQPGATGATGTTIPPQHSGGMNVYKRTLKLRRVLIA